MMKRWLMLFLALAGLAAGASVASAQATAPGHSSNGPRFLRATASSFVPLNVERTPVLNQRVSLAMEGSIEAAFAELTRQTGVEFMYGTDAVSPTQAVRVRVEDVPMAAALAELLKGYDVDVVVPERGGTLIVRRRPGGPGSTAPGARADTGVIAGFVQVAGSDEALPNVQIVLDGARRVTTNHRGVFLFRGVEAGEHTLQASLIGYRTDSTRVVVRADSVSTAMFTLEISPTQLTDVVVTATGDRRRVEIGSDITIIRADSIVATEPITSVTDLLEGRVPGLVVQRTSGAPGDPARIRLRGASSPNLSNDPIVIVDGVRVYSEQSDARGGNLAGQSNLVGVGQEHLYAAPSPLDYIDPNSIETIQVVRGPSAATLYGQDAANGVIVITTKRGREGPPRWTITAGQGQSRIPGEFPELHVRWGRPLADNTIVLCPINNRASGIAHGAACQADSVAVFQTLNDPALTVLGQGHSSELTLGVSGGASGLTYNVTGSYRDEVGLIRLPAFEAERYAAERGSAPPDWMRRPQSLEQWSASARIRAQLGTRAHVSLTTGLSRTEQQRSSLENQLDLLMSSVRDPVTGSYLSRAGQPGSPIDIASSDQLLTSYYERATATATRSINGVGLNWQPRPWLTTAAEAGVDVVQRVDEIFLPPGVPVAEALADGRLQSGKGTSVVSTLNLRAGVRAPLGRGFHFQLGTGVNYTDRSVDDVQAAVRGMAEGTESMNGAAEVLMLNQHRADQATFGLFIEPGINHSRFWLSTGIRLDGGSTFGSRQTLPAFPKVSVSYLLSDEPAFPDALRPIFGTLRLRAAYGHAGRQPGPTDRLRLYGHRVSEWVDGGFGDAVFLQTLGNTALKPERTREFEGGFDADLFDDRVTVGVTGYRQTTEDALLSVPVAPSVYGPNVAMLRNIGVLRNSGVELNLAMEPVRSSVATWAVQLSMNRNRNVVVELGPGVEPFYTSMTSFNSGIRVAPGYPLFGRWSKPVLGYADTNGNGRLDPGEVVLGDTMVYMGATLPDYTASLHSTVSLLNGTLALSVGLLYEDGMTQRNEVLERLSIFSRAWNDPSSPLSEQLPIFDGSEYTWSQTVNSLRLNSLTARYQLPTRLAASVGAQALSVSVQGRNLGLWTNYRGLDPHVNARATGNDVTDTGVLPQPRYWQLRLSASY